MLCDVENHSEEWESQNLHILFCPPCTIISAKFHIKQSTWLCCRLYKNKLGALIIEKNPRKNRLTAARNETPNKFELLLINVHFSPLMFKMKLYSAADVYPFWKYFHFFSPQARHREHKKRHEKKCFILFSFE